MKTEWTWEEWQATRPVRRALSAQIAPQGSERPASSSDRRLRAAYAGRRGPFDWNRRPETTRGAGPANEASARRFKKR